MFTIQVKDKRTGNFTEEVLAQITEKSTGYEYGQAVADSITEPVKNHTSAEVSVFHDGELIHRLLIVPKGGAVMVTENGAGTKPLSFRFAVNTVPLPEKYLIMVNPEHNNNKFYRMADLGGGKWGAFYGRIGEGQGESVYSQHVKKPHEYPDYMYGIKLLEKLLKGYKDKSDCHIDKDTAAPVVKQEFAKIKDAVIENLIRRLMQFANRAIEENYMVGSESVTEKMIEEARAELNALRGSVDLESFNRHLLELMHIIPRRIDGYGSGGVMRMMAQAADDFARILVREEDLLSVMEGQVHVNEKKKDTSAKQVDILEAMGLEIYPATVKQVEEVKKNLDGGLAGRLKAVYRVVNKNTQKRFDNYRESCERKPQVKLFWHGSRNCNWIHILQKGLLLNPDARVTGKMFGQGIYFAPSAMKSWGYTSSPRAKYTNERSDTAFMALYATAYGRPFNVYDHHLFSPSFNYNDLKHYAPSCSCVHAKKDRGMLRADEIIFYREDQMTIKYLCEFAA